MTAAWVVEERYRRPGGDWSPWRAIELPNVVDERGARERAESRVRALEGLAADPALIGSYEYRTAHYQRIEP